MPLKGKRTKGDLQRNIKAWLRHLGCKDITQTSHVITYAAVVADDESDILQCVDKYISDGGQDQDQLVDELAEAGVNLAQLYIGIIVTTSYFSKED